MGGNEQTIEPKRESLADGLPEIFAKRRQQLLFRIGTMGLILVFFSRYGTLREMATWSAVYAVLQCVEIVAFQPSRIDDNLRGLAALGLLTLNSLVFGWPALVWGFHGGAVGLMNAIYLVCGALLNTVLTTRNCKAAFVASLWPHLLYAAIIALQAGGPGHDGGAILTVALGGAVLGVSAVTLWRDASATRRSELSAQASILRSQGELREVARAAEAANRAKGDFLANMSHEIRTPLNGVIGMADILAHSDLSPSEREMAEIIRDSGVSLQRLLSDILDMARIESGKLAIESAPFHLGEAVRTVTALSALACEAKGLRLSVTVAAELDGHVLGDCVRVRQVLTNLLSNAAKFTETGEIGVSVQPAPAGGVRFLVVDTGLGFAMSEKARVLGRFEQADSSITRKFGGTGLGLSICSDLAQLMGGMLDCESEPGRGSRFWMDVPLPAATAPLAQDDRRPATLDSGPLRVLVADDHPTNRKVLEMMLRSAEVDLATVENGLQVLERCAVQSFDLVLLDMQMPVMDGLTCLRRLRASEAAAGAARTPVIMLTANALPEHVEQALAAGADLHLGKPLTAAALFQAMDAVLSAAAPAASAAA